VTLETKKHAIRGVPDAYKALVIDCGSYNEFQKRFAEQHREENKDLTRDDFYRKAHYIWKRRGKYKREAEAAAAAPVAPGETPSTEGAGWYYPTEEEKRCVILHKTVGEFAQDYTERFGSALTGTEISTHVYSLWTRRAPIRKQMASLDKARAVQVELEAQQAQLLAEAEAMKLVAEETVDVPEPCEPPARPARRRPVRGDHIPDIGELTVEVLNELITIRNILEETLVVQKAQFQFFGGLAAKPKVSTS